MKVRMYNIDDLKFSATARCKCGAGLAYPKDGSQPEADSVFKMASDWWCYKILTGTDESIPGGHQIFPFSMYEIKSEDQPSANGLTTKPKGGE